MNHHTQNKQAIEYNLSIQSQLAEVCAPLKTIGVKAFTYYRVFEDGSYIFLSNDHRPVAYCIQNFNSNGEAFQENIRKSQLNKYHFMVWPKDHNDEIISYYADALSLGNALCIYRRLSDGSIESWGFIADLDNFAIVDEYMNHTGTFTKFIEYFNLKAKDLIDVSNPSRLAHYPIPMDISEQSSGREESLLTHSMFKSSMNSDLGMAHLTRSERKILDLLSTGRTMKEISASIGCSPRTVETHLRNVKKKTKLNYKSELIDYYNQLQ